MGNENREVLLSVRDMTVDFGTAIPSGRWTM